jgi:deazaflavin-dependent oxidoreductase (nitroreductase family)
MRKIAKTMLVIVGVVVVVFELVDTAVHQWAWRSRSPRSLRFIKLYNKYVINPAMLRFSGRHGISAIVHHTGRRSGTPYATPVVAHRSDQDVIIPLPYGSDVDWLHNLLASGEAVVDLDGDHLRVDEPQVVDIDDVVDLFPTSMVRTVRFNGAHEAARLHVSGAAPPTSG